MTSRSFSITDAFWQSKLNSDGADVLNIPRVSNATNNSVITNVGGDANNLTCESNLKFDGDELSVTGESLHIQSSTAAKPVLLIENTNADAAAAILKFYKSSTSSPAAADQVGLFKFVGKDAAGDDADMAFIVCKAQTVTDSAYEGGLHFGVASAGANTVSTLSLVGQGTAKTTLCCIWRSLGGQYNYECWYRNSCSNACTHGCRNHFWL